VLTSLSSLLEKARKGGYAVIAPDFPNLLLARTYIQCAQRLEAPLILSYAPSLKPAMDLSDYKRFIEVVRDEIASVRIPIALHLDHATNVQDIEEALGLGFTSVMIDASLEPWEINLARTNQVVHMAHAVGVEVEAEIGHVAIGGRYLGDEKPTDHQNVFTDPVAAMDFIKRTGVDALAVSIGTIHGAYQGEPKLNFELLDQLNKISPVPLVLHGSSGTGDENIRKAITLGIRKINVYSDIISVIRKSLLESLSRNQDGFIDWMDAQTSAVGDELARYIDISGSQGKGS
jgi:ketose-bisphosphate aldolase